MPAANAFVIFVNFRSAVGVYGSKDLRGDGSVASEKILSYQSSEAAESMAKVLREQFPDTSYRVMTFGEARKQLQA